jgi:hypothetical protein
MNKQKEISKEEDIKNLIKNFNLLRIVEKIEARKSVINHGSVLNERDKSFKSIIIEDSVSEFSSNDDKRKKGSHTQQKNNQDEQNQSSDYKCKKHNLLAHSYAIGTNMYFCDLCVKETKLKISPIPNVNIKYYIKRIYKSFKITFFSYIILYYTSYFFNFFRL